MFRRLIPLFFLVFAINNMKAGEHSIGFGVGPTFALTDLGGSIKVGRPGIVDVDPQAIRFCFSIHYRYHVNDFFSVKANIMFGMLNGDDKYTKGTPPPNTSDSWFREMRNLNFTTYLGEASVMGEVNLKRYQLSANGKREPLSWAPYVGVGAGFFYFEPFTTYLGKVYNLRKVGTEGQNVTGKRYSPFQFDLLASLGIKYNVNNAVAIAVEGIYHQTFTDYLDDVSTNYPGQAVYNQMTPIAQALSNRNLEPGAPYPDPKYHFIIRERGYGQQRGDKKDKDHFFNFQISLIINVGRKKSRDMGCYYRSRNF